MKTLKMIRDDILIIPYTQEKTPSGIIIPSDKHMVKNVGFISAVGDKVRNKEELKEGVCVVIPRHTGQWVEFDGFKYIKVQEKDIIAIFTDVKMIEGENTNGNDE